MILVLSGTSDGNRLIRELANLGYRVLATAVTPYGAYLAREAGALEVYQGELDKTSFKELVQREKVGAVIDATHPYAEKITSIAQEVAEDIDIPYLRLRREFVPVPPHPLVNMASDWEEAAEAAARAQGNTVFLAIGSRHLEVFANHEGLRKKRLVVRILPDRDSLEKCLKLGFWPRDIIALQGPFSYELNLALFREYKAEILVTKDSGHTGGLLEKIQAALDLGLEVILLRRPPEPPGLRLEEILKVLEANL
ncbi:MAG: precorrin-6A reductase [Thermanaeromonas sp.]|uniref:precorrin-6A reductase n=1 Tax=Thermanaeromonas sp. TaxID=2003697 RepID=UPI002440A5FF|nr:precorrin-6A reductase [Thermanaeromonas sp.]MCG0278716.1 precorrin-6A reductase [Thermanaeromonas sp.]